MRGAGSAGSLTCLWGAALCALSACGGGGGGNQAVAMQPSGEPPTAQPPAPEPPAGPAPSAATIRGTVTFARIPLSPNLGSGLDYAATRQDPARGVTVELVDESTQQVIDSTVTDAAGKYALNAAPGTSVRIRVSAEMRGAVSQGVPRWQFEVRDVDHGNQLYTYSTDAFDSGTTSSSRDVDIPSGWNKETREVEGTRDSAPFAILDTVYRAFNFVLDVAPDVRFPRLTLDWATDNPGGVTFYSNDAGGDNRTIVIAGEADVDTDEFDQHVLAHEFGHYLEDRFSRSDSIGGEHSPGDRLDPRLAFGEGFGYAFASMVLGDPEPRDTFGASQANDSFFNIEQDSAIAGINGNTEGWFSEASVQEILWDLFDEEPDGSDNANLGFAPLWQALTGDQATTVATTGIFSFITALRESNFEHAAAIDAIVEGESIVASGIDAFGSTETNAASSADVLPVYTPIAVGGTQTVRSIPSFGTGNKLSNHRLLRLDVVAPALLRITATGPAGRDIDIRLLRQGRQIANSEGTTNVEEIRAALEPGTYVLDTYDCGNVLCGMQPPMGTDITVSVAAE